MRYLKWQMIKRYQVDIVAKSWRRVVRVHFLTPPKHPRTCLLCISCNSIHLLFTCSPRTLAAIRSLKLFWSYSCRWGKLQRWKGRGLKVQFFYSQQPQLAWLFRAHCISPHFSSLAPLLLLTMTASLPYHCCRLHLISYSPPLTTPNLGTLASNLTFWSTLNLAKQCQDLHVLGCRLSSSCAIQLIPWLY